MMYSIDMENQNGTSKPLIKQHSHSRQFSQDHFVFDLDVDVLDHHHKLKQESTDSDEHFSSPDFGIHSPLASPEPVTFSQSSGYDPKRIPQSVFSTRPTTPMEWSVASNESLFSIHLGNSSFSKENFLLFNKSGELPKAEDQPGKSAAKPDEPSTLSKPDESNKVPPSSPRVTKFADNMDRVLAIDEVNNNNQQKISPDTRSEGSNSTTSIKSFQFPVLENDTGRHTSIKREILKEMENRRHTSLKREILMEEKEKRPFTRHSQPQRQPHSSELLSDSQSQEQLRPQLQTSPKTPKFGSNTGWFSCIPCLSPRTLIKKPLNN